MVTVISDITFLNFLQWTCCYCSSAGFQGPASSPQRFALATPTSDGAALFNCQWLIENMSTNHGKRGWADLGENNYNRKRIWIFVSFYHLAWTSVSMWLVAFSSLLTLGGACTGPGLSSTVYCRIFTGNRCSITSRSPGACCFPLGTTNPMLLLSAYLLFVMWLFSVSSFLHSS